MYHNNNKMPRECKLGDQCNVNAVFPEAPDDNGQLCVRDSRNIRVIINMNHLFYQTSTLLETI